MRYQPVQCQLCWQAKSTTQRKRRGNSSSVSVHHRNEHIKQKVLLLPNMLGHILWTVSIAAAAHYSTQTTLPWWIKPPGSCLGLGRISFYLIIAVWVKSTPGALGPGGTNKRWHTSTLRQSGVWTWTRRSPTPHGRVQNRWSTGAVFALCLSVFIKRLTPMMVVVLVVLLVMPSMAVRVLHNVLHLWVIWMARLLERHRGWRRWMRRMWRQGQVR